MPDPSSSNPPTPESPPNQPSHNFPQFPVSAPDKKTVTDEKSDNPFLEQYLQKLEKELQQTKCCKPESARSPGINDRQQLAITHILTGFDDTKVAELVGVDRRTIFNWRKSRIFVDELEAQRRALRSAADNRMLSLLPKVCNVLDSVLNQTEDPRAALQAASILLRQFMKQYDLWTSSSQSPGRP